MNTDDDARPSNWSGVDPYSNEDEDPMKIRLLRCTIPRTTPAPRAPQRRGASVKTWTPKTHTPMVAYAVQTVVNVGFELLIFALQTTHPDLSGRASERLACRRAVLHRGQPDAGGIEERVNLVLVIAIVGVVVSGGELLQRQ
jgi:hypothetical protein